MSSITIIADGSTRLFAFPFAILGTDEIEVLVDGTPVTSGIDITGEGASDGGHVSFAVPPTADATVTLRRLGKAEVSDQDAPGFLEDKLAAGANIAIAKTTAPGGEALVISTTIDPDDYLRKDQNLADLPDAATARANLGLGTAAILDAGTGAGDVVQLDAQGRLPAVDGSQLTDIPFGRVKVAEADTVADFLGTKLAAGDNVTLTAIAGTSGQAVEIAAATDPAVNAQLSALSDQVSNLIWNQGLLALRSQIGAGWSVLRMVDGWADEFEDEAGVDTGGSANASYDAAGDFFEPAGGAAVVTVREASGAPFPVSYVTTYADRTYTLQNSATVNSIGVYSAHASTSLVIKVLRENSSSNFDVVHSQQVTHAGVGWQDFTLTSPFAVPATGTYRFAYCPNGQSVTMGGAAGSRAWRDDNSTGTDLTFVEDASSLPNFRIGYQAPPADMDLVSSPVIPAQSAPAEARLLLLHEPVDAVTLNTDLIAEVSRDDGTSWSAATLADEGPFDGFTRILAGIADLSAQPSGTAMKWRVRTLNAKSQRLHGVWIQWR